MILVSPLRGQHVFIYEDNLACMAMSENPVGRKYSRHIDIHRYFVRDLVAQQVLKLLPLRTNLMVADDLTKSLTAPAHARHRDTMIGRTRTHPLLRKHFAPCHLCSGRKIRVG